MEEVIRNLDENDHFCQEKVSTCQEKKARAGRRLNRRNNVAVNMHMKENRLGTNKADTVFSRYEEKWHSQLTSVEKFLL
jgi:hypothetical protein